MVHQYTFKLVHVAFILAIAIASAVFAGMADGWWPMIRAGVFGACVASFVCLVYGQLKLGHIIFILAIAIFSAFSGGVTVGWMEVVSQGAIGALAGLYLALAFKYFREMRKRRYGTKED